MAKEISSRSAGEEELEDFTLQTSREDNQSRIYDRAKGPQSRILQPTLHCYGVEPFPGVKGQPTPLWHCAPPSRFKLLKFLSGVDEKEVVTDLDTSGPKFYPVEGQNETTFKRCPFLPVELENLWRLIPRLQEHFKVLSGTDTDSFLALFNTPLKDFSGSELVEGLLTRAEGLVGIDGDSDLAAFVKIVHDLIALLESDDVGQSAFSDIQSQRYVEGVLQLEDLVQAVFEAAFRRWVDDPGNNADPFFDRVNALGNAKKLLSGALKEGYRKLRDPKGIFFAAAFNLGRPEFVYVPEELKELFGLELSHGDLGTYRWSNWVSECPNLGEEQLLGLEQRLCFTRLLLGGVKREFELYLNSGDPQGIYYCDPNIFKFGYDGRSKLVLEYWLSKRKY